MRLEITMKKNWKIDKNCKSKYEMKLTDYRYEFMAESEYPLN